MVSIHDIIRKDINYTKDKTFMITFSKERMGDKQKKYVQIKVIKIKKEHGYLLMIQIVDISDKMLFSQMKAEQTLLMLINATVSHELRNPLNSLIG